MMPASIQKTSGVDTTPLLVKQQEPLTWETVTTHRAWRHTIGRISCLVRIPFYFLATLAQASKVVIKTCIATVTLNQLDRLGSEGKKFTYRAVERDALGLISLVDRTVNSMLCVVCAPPKQYYSLLEGPTKVFKLVILDKIHLDNNKKEIEITAIFNMVVENRPQYHKQIFASDSIFKNTIVSLPYERMSVFSNIKAC